MAAAFGALFLLVYPMCAVVGYVPTLAIAVDGAGSWTPMAPDGARREEGGA